MDVSSLIMHNGTDSCIRDSTFIMFWDENESLARITYAQYLSQSLAYGCMLKGLKERLGIDPGERFHVGVFMQNIPEFFFILGGCAFTGATLVGVNNAQVGEKLAFDINNIDMHVLFVDHAKQPNAGGTFLDTVLRAKETQGFTSLTEDLIFLTGVGNAPGRIRTVGDMLREASVALPSFEPEPLDKAQPGVIIFTSGTTGAPKGIEVTWQKLYDTGVTGTRILSYSKDDVGYVCMPVNHSNSLYLNIMPAMLNGAGFLIRRRFSVRNFVSDLEAVGATVWNCVGDPVQYVLNHIEKEGGPADFSRLPLRTVISTGTNAPNRAAFTRMFGLDIFTEIYGSTEAGAITAVDAGTPEYSVGKLLRDIRIVSESSGRECDLARVDRTGRITNLDASAGEIVVSQESLGASAFTGYYKLPGENAKKILLLDGKKFYRMGDLGAVVERDGARYLVFLGRTGDWIRFKGENWAPVDAEKVIGKYEGITNSGIIGVPQPVGREDDPMYIIETPEPQAFDPVPFYAFCRENLPHYMLPRFIRLVKSVPMTDTMKLRKSVLKSEFYFRTPESDASVEDIIHVVQDGRPRRFLAADFQAELARFRDPTNRDTLNAYTKRSDLFGEGGANA
jgi:fatty-acyl-CoA synthase